MPNFFILQHRSTNHLMVLRGLSLVLALFLSACSTLQPLPNVAGQSAHGAWVELIDVQPLTISPGVMLHLPDAPYRARFADKDGLFFQASRPLQFHTQHGFINEVEGGLYMRHDQPGLASTWFYPGLGAPATPAHVSVKIQFYPASR
jgi:hypothetical protein